MGTRWGFGACTMGNRNDSSLERAASMNSDLDEFVDIPIPKAACLVLFELLTTAYEKWRPANPDDRNAEALVVSANSHAERMALWKLEGALERTLPEVFSSNYSELLEQSRERLDR